MSEKINFPKTEKIEVRLRQDLAYRLPEDKSEKNAFIIQAIENKLDGITGITSAASLMGRKGGSAKSESKTEAVRENGKKGGRPYKYQPEKPGKLEARVKNSNGREGTIWADPAPGKYILYVRYDGAKEATALKPEYQPKKGGPIPDVEVIAEMAGFTLI